MRWTSEHIRVALGHPPHRVPIDDFTQASVALVFTPGLDLVLMSRAQSVDDPWSGQVSLPGGRVDPGDSSSLAAAIRETQEEIGVDLSDAVSLGELDEVRTIQPLPAILIRPHVFQMTKEPMFRPNHEVASVHRIPLATLLLNTGRDEMAHPWRGISTLFPCVRFDGVCLWGLTLHIIDDLLHRIDGGGRGLARIPAVVDAIKAPTGKETGP